MAVPSPNSVALVEHVGPSAWTAPRGAPTDNLTTAVESFDKLVECLFFIAAEPCRANRKCAHYKGHFGAWYTALLLAAHQSPESRCAVDCGDGRSISSSISMARFHPGTEHRPTVTSLDIVITVKVLPPLVATNLLVPGGMSSRAKPQRVRSLKTVRIRGRLLSGYLRQV